MHALGFKFAVLLALILGNGLFVMAEIALVSSRKSKLQQLAEGGDSHARAALDLIQSPVRFLAMVQIGITLITILAGLYGGEAFAGRLEEGLSGLPFLGHHRHTVAFWMVVLAIAYLQIILGELLPKSLALRHPE